MLRFAGVLAAGAVLAYAGFGLTARSSDLSVTTVDVSGYMKGYVNVSWNPVSNASGYGLYRDGVLVATAGSSAQSTRFYLQPGQHDLLVKSIVATTTTAPTTVPTTTAVTTTVGTTTTVPTTTTTSPSTELPQQGITMPLGNITSKSSTDQDWMLDQVKALGNGHPMLLRVDWWPNTPGFSTIASKAASRGITLLPLLSYDSGNRPSQSTYASQAGQLAGLGFKYIDLLNEPDMSGWTPQDAANYFNAGKAAIKEVNPNAVVVGPSVWKTQTQNPADGFAWDKAFLDAGGKPDVFDIHLYNYFSCDRSWNNWAWLPDLRASLDAHGLQNVPIMTTEAGDNADLNGTARQQDAVVTGMGARDKGYVAHGCTVTVPIVSFMDYSLLNDATPGGFGIFDNSRNARPAYGSFKSLSR